MFADCDESSGNLTHTSFAPFCVVLELKHFGDSKLESL